MRRGHRGCGATGCCRWATRPVVALGALHQLLVAPIQRLLPAERGSLLTILPHGPLFRLSFAALRNPTGQYLVERYAIHYVPAGVVLGLAEQHARASETGDRRYLLIADPQTPPSLPGGKPLPRLPGTRREVSQVAALVPAAAATSLVGANATEQRVRSLAGDRSVLHFATHGVIRADDPLESFLALDTGDTAASHRPALGLRRSQRWTVDGARDLRDSAECRPRRALRLPYGCRRSLRRRRHRAGARVSLCGDAVGRRHAVGRGRRTGGAIDAEPVSLVDTGAGYGARAAPCATDAPSRPAKRPRQRPDEIGNRDSRRTSDSVGQLHPRREAVESAIAISSGNAVPRRTFAPTVVNPAVESIPSGERADQQKCLIVELRSVLPRRTDQSVLQPFERGGGVLPD